MGQKLIWFLGNSDIDRYSENFSSIISRQSNKAFGVRVYTFPRDRFHERLTKLQKEIPNSRSIESSRVSTSLPSESFGDSLNNGYMDQESMFGLGLPLWNSDNFNEDLLAGFLPQYYGQLDMQLGDS